jgi:hypothetical protein
MTYNTDMGWFDLTAEASNMSNAMIGCITNAKRAYDEWQSFRAGRDNATIAAAVGRTTGDIANIDSCFAAGLALYNYANNGTPSQGDYMYSLRIFS